MDLHKARMQQNNPNRPPKKGEWWTR
jgi:hypothetical protein